MADASSPEGYVWLRMKNKRRSSMVSVQSQAGSQGALSSLAQQHAAAQARGKGAAQQRAHRVLQVIQEMIEHYNEV